MEFTSALSLNPTPEEAVRELAGEAGRKLAATADLALLFVSGYAPEEAERIAAGVFRQLAPFVMIGCTCEGVIGAGQEVERKPAASLLIGALPGVELHPFHIGMRESAVMAQESAVLKARTQSGETPKGYLLLGDPYTTPIRELLQTFSEIAPGVTVAGGMASSGHEPGTNRLFVNDRVLSEGMIGVSLAGPVRLMPVVSQGCRAVGPHFLVTSAAGNIIETLGDRPALQVFQELANSLPPDEVDLLRQGVFVGLTIEETADPFGRGEVLVRQLMGADPETGAVAVGDEVIPGQTLQFYVRDADSADDELNRLLRDRRLLSPPAAGLLFSCNGRGTRMFPRPHHDAQATDAAFPHLPVAGFFAAGEIGAVGGVPFLHGHTASIAFITPDE